MSTLTRFSDVRYGQFENLDIGIDSTDNSIYVSVPSIERMLGYRPDSGREKLRSKSLKAFADKPLRVGKKFQTIDIAGNRNYAKFVPFDTFLQLVYWEAIEGKGEPKYNAAALMKAGFADSFTSLVLEQCGIKLSSAQRQQVVSFYIGSYHEFQDWVRDRYLEKYGVKPEPEYYRSIAVTINRCLFGFDHFRCDRLTHAETVQLRKLENFQMLFMDSVYPAKAKQQNLEPLEAVNCLLETFR